MGFRKGKGTGDAIFKLIMISERVIQMNTEKWYKEKGKEGEKIVLILCRLSKGIFDRIRYDKLLEVMEKIGIPELERRLILSLYWNHYASVRWNGEVSRDVKVEKRMRQGSVISPLLFNLYSEYMMREALEDMEGVTFN